MRGGLKNQITCVLKEACRFGASRHKAKRIYGGKSPYIHAVGTFNKTALRLHPLAAWLKKHKMRDLEKLTAEVVGSYLEERFAHHLAQRNARQTFKVELSAIGSLERGLNFFSKAHRGIPLTYDFSEVRAEFRKRAKCLPLKTSPYKNRALPRPMAMIDALTQEHHKIMAKLQLVCGCRTEGVGAPERDYPGGNTFGIANFCDEEGSLLPEVGDPITAARGRQIWTKEKGGKVAWKFCPAWLAEEVFAWLTNNPDGLGDNYHNYRAAVVKAMRDTEQFIKGKGTHSLRYGFAQRRYKECILSGMGDEEAKLTVTHEMSHNRPDITETYY